MKNFKQLSRAEMKLITGGMAAKIECDITNAPGWVVSGPFTCFDTTADDCQARADKWCLSDDACDGVDCPGAV